MEAGALLISLVACTIEAQGIPPAGKTGTVCGRVVTYDDDARNKCAVRLDIGRPYWRKAFYILIPAESVLNFSPAPSDRYLFHEVCVTGTVQKDPEGVRHMVVSRPEAITIKRAANVPPFGAGAQRPCGPDKPVLLREVRPIYTQNAMAALVQGLVFLDAVVGVDGTVTDARVVYGLEDSLDQQALKAVRGWRFKPATKDGVPVRSIVQVEMAFRLK